MTSSYSFRGGAVLKLNYSRDCNPDMEASLIQWIMEKIDLIYTTEN